jgi:SAM-dependent methyltransferase
MHPSAYNAIRDMLVGTDTEGLSIVEFGAFDVNGSVRPLFPGAASYVGVDVRDGPGVDIVADATEYTPDAPVDIVVSTETLEHMARPELLIAAAWRALKPGGRLLITAAATGRAPHGVDGRDVGDEPYQNIDPDALRTWLDGWSDVQVIYNPHTADVYAVATKPATTKKARA